MSNTTFTCPSNIALVKYWGKKNGGVQLPANPSVSLTLSDLLAETKVTLLHGNISGKPAFSFLFDGERKIGFETKIEKFLSRIYQEYTVVQQYHLHIESKNNFPHGSGIASSAAGFGALALCISDLQQSTSGINFPDFLTEASRIARLGSGSACRSMFSQPAIWGEHDNIVNSTDFYAIPWQGNWNATLANLQDIVLLVDAGEKAVSSSDGHGLLAGNFYAESRYKAATDNLWRLLQCMEKGNIRSFISIVESEALQLHAMMMVSSPYYLLFRPNTIAIIEKIWAYREKSGLPVMFTLDAGANVHLLFPMEYKTEIVNFIESELLVYCEKGQYLCTATGGSPQKIA